MALKDLSQKELREGALNKAIVLEHLYAKFKCKGCRRTWSSNCYRRFNRDGDIMSLPQACNKCGRKTHPHLIKPVS